MNRDDDIELPPPYVDYANAPPPTLESSSTPTTSTTTAAVAATTATTGTAVASASASTATTATSAGATSETRTTKTEDTASSFTTTTEPTTADPTTASSTTATATKATETTTTKVSSKSRQPTTTTTTTTTTTSSSARTNFPVMLHAMLTLADMSGYAHICAWEPHGRAFSVHDREAFVEQVLPLYFRQKRFESIQRQLNLYGFERVSLQQSNPHNSPGAYYHAMFLRTRHDLCGSIQRSTEKDRDRKTSRIMAIPDPDFVQFAALPPIGPEHIEAARRAAALPFPQQQQ